MHGLLLALALTLDPKTADESALRIATLIEESYVDAEAAKRCAEHVRARVAAGAFAQAATPAAFAAIVTDELRRNCGDRHFEVALRTPPPDASAPAPPEDPNAWKADLRERNYDFPRVERLTGNVGYLQVNSFPPPEVAGDTAQAAMAFVASADAVIIDLRLNSGGTGNMVNFLVSYFFEEPALLSTTYRRATNRTTENWTLSFVPGKRMSKMPLYVLTSSRTFSAAEAFAAPLQALKRATIVGEVTRGGANPGRMRRVNDLFDVFVPVGATKVAINDKSWDGTGITPDIPTRATDALLTAHRAAVAHLVANTKDAERKRELEWIRDLLAISPDGAAIPSAELQRWVGRYGNRVITLEDGRLLQAVDGGPQRPLLALSPSTFVISGAESVRLRFEPSRVMVERSSGRVEVVDRAAN
jgi:hypothetical protein